MSWFSFMKNEQYLAQVGHLLGGATLIETAGIFALVRGAGWPPIWWTLAIGIIAASLKEFVFDILVEKDGWPNSIMDWTFYILGGAVGIAVIGIAHAIAIVCFAIGL